jgi:hypothetical protein
LTDYQILHPERRENHVSYDAAGNVGQTICLTVRG